MQVGLEPLIPQQLLRRVLLRTQVDDLYDPYRRKRCFGLLEGFEHLDDERPYLQQWLIGQFLLIEVHIVEIHINKVE